MILGAKGGHARMCKVKESKQGQATQEKQTRLSERCTVSRSTKGQTNEGQHSKKILRARVADSK